MKKRVLMIITVVILSFTMLAGCGNEQVVNDTPTELPTVTEAPTVTPTPKPTELVLATNTPTPTPTNTPTPKPTELVLATNTPTPTNTPTTKPTNTPTPKPTELVLATNTPTPTPTNTPTPKPTNTPAPTPTNTPTPTPTNTPTPTPTEVPIVKKVGKVDNAEFNKVKATFKEIIVKARKDGIINPEDICVVMDNTSVKVDLNLNDSDTDLILSKNEESGIYVLTLDFQFIWLPELTENINGIEPAPYNKDLLIAVLSLVSEEPNTLFDTIDQTYFSSYSLDDVEWTAVGDCYMLNGDYEYEVFCQYQITKTKPEKVYNRDAMYVLKAAGNAGTSNLECEIEYDSSITQFRYNMNGAWYTKYGFVGDSVVYFGPLDEMADGACGLPVIRSGCSSYEDYKSQLKKKILAKGVPESALWFSEFDSCTVNGYTYYAIEYGYMTETDIDNDTMVYVQLTDNEYLEICNACFYSYLDEFVNTVFYIKTVK